MIAFIGFSKIYVFMSNEIMYVMKLYICVHVIRF